MSAVKIAFSECAVRLTLKNSDKLGKKIKCPKCGVVFVAKPVEEQQSIPDADDDWLNDDFFEQVQKASGDSRKLSKNKSARGKKSSGNKKATAMSKSKSKRGPDSKRTLLFAGIVSGAIVVVLATWAIVAFTGNKNDDKPNNDNVTSNDRNITALLDDLDQRGLLDTTLVVAMGEFGRTPRINKRASRDHWPRCYFSIWAGAGVQPGRVIGQSDKFGEDPATSPVTPLMVGTTIAELAGVDTAKRAEMKVLDGGRTIDELF
jgi:uncharacterized protein (DUF1501 family)